ncbi:hypothetical protein WICPIJ_002727 [Wickerhamomyces pijperi]|uniref:DNA2/NAM7 helicase-like C-terminal domain-containing protein n=1 Tax=Wickerhamomyces pijperi TaxID=599730 RepID=A0A9P8TPW9_WICPI|nr:hypothetical protein WICPIJ_002727 [Wickerhamomyces pijperi]
MKTNDGISVCSTDSYQGKEPDVVIFACTRSNPRNELRILSEPRRMNVALTRARRSLIVLGDRICLGKSKSPSWKGFVEFAEAKDAVNPSKFFNGVSRLQKLQRSQ